MSSDKKSTHSEVGDLKKRSDVIELLVTYTNFLLGAQYVDTDVYGEEPTAIDVFMTIWDDDNRLTPTKPVEITEDEIDQVIKTIALLSSMIDGGEVHSHDSVKMKEKSIAILTKLNGER